MKDQWEYQVRVYLGEDLAQLARTRADDEMLKPLNEVLARRHALLRNQLDAFREYVEEAEKRGTESFPLYKWTKATIEDPAKQAKYMKSFTVEVEGESLYGKDVADALEKELQPLVASGLLERLSKHDSNPAHNPQPPAHLAG